MSKTKSGFTLIELLIVIALIGLLASIILVSVQTSRTKALYARAQRDEATIYEALQNLISDTGKWPSGCPVGQANQLSTDLSNLTQRPAVGSGLGLYGCTWTQDDVNNWNGPYIGNQGANAFVDPWGSGYSLLPGLIDNDPALASYQMVIVSPGPDHSLSRYQDNINLILQ